MIFHLTAKGIVDKRRRFWITAASMAAFLGLVLFLLCDRGLADGSLSPWGFLFVFLLIAGLPLGGFVISIIRGGPQPDELEMGPKALLRRRDGKTAEIAYSSITQMRVSARSGEAFVIFLRSDKNQWVLYDYEDMPRLARELGQALGKPELVETTEALPPKPYRKVGAILILVGILLLLALVIVGFVTIGSATGLGLPLCFLVFAIASFKSNRANRSKRILAVLAMLAVAGLAFFKYMAAGH